MRRTSDATTWRESLALHRNVVLVGVAAGLFALGESLWFRFAPLYLQALGASVLVVGLWGTLYDLLDAAWQYPAGHIADRVGTRRALVTLTLAAIGGILLFIVPFWPVVLFGLILYMSENAYSQPVTFAIIGEALPREKRAMGFVVQSAIKRVPQIIGILGAGYLLIDRYGVLTGIRYALIAALVVTILALVLQLRYFREPAKTVIDPQPMRIADFPTNLRRLLASDVLIRMGESATRVFIVLYVVDELGFTAGTFGLMTALLIVTSLVVYVPAARAADAGARKPWVVFTFAAFTLYPLAILLSFNIWLLALAFIIGGLREIGEPARKASIVDMAPPHLRGRVVGAYYAIRGFSIMPTALVAGALYAWRPAAPFVAGAVVSLGGLLLYATTVKKE